ncbi:glycoside hydrolase family 68 protein [Haloarcula salinisoli]|uniref:Glycoside hydrolase family 68 protein n=1 Tax=Haloarcula salinisoli TaxID=2487746 RepID=A0A8J7YDS0_9EURY|nr:glycoside hydrolase family 68 protein [Halomicroarcula salinisoli]MBX0284915.1 glycoside hydrolase family 68 protein [Halomicroarcula salinisoli]MBX0303607.1 glycoside hydrolase family 68 protein [Halomicroarcula salinisoli]
MNDHSPGEGAPGYRARAGWTREQAAGLERTGETTAPVFYPPETDQMPHLHIWDTWFLRERDGTLAEVDGYRVCFSLTAPAELLPGKRHDVATIRAFYSADGREWQDAGPVFSEALGQRQWAGSALYDDGDVYLFYTAAGTDGAEELTYSQRIVAASGGRVDTTDGFELRGPWTHHELLSPDGERYEREDQSRAMIYTFRDPWFFEDPETGETWLLFEANSPVPEGSDLFDGDAGKQEFNGSVGIAHSPTGDPLAWELEAPLLDAVGVNQELERPHVVYRDGLYYLFISSHLHTFGPELSGYDALYGFVAEELHGEYVPLNGSGLVATNPPNAPFQAYSWMAFPHDGEVLVQNFFNYFDFAGETLDEIAHLPESEQRRRFGGTLGPTLRLDVSGTRTEIVGKLGHWEIPMAGESLGPTERELLARAHADDQRGGYGH